MQIRRDDLRGVAIARLLRAHLDEMASITAAGHVHALDLDRLRSPEVTFWSAWEGDELLGCGALKELDARTGELKSMHTARAHRGRGVGAAILEHILATARARDYEAVHLETGAQPAFARVREFYARAGFVPCGAFGAYVEDGHSAFMTRRP